MGCKYPGYISYASWVIANLVLKFTHFRYHGNRGQSEQRLTDNIKLPDPYKTLLNASIWVISSASWFIANFVLKFANFRYHGNKGRSRVNFNDTVKLRNLKNPVWCNNLGYISYVCRVMHNFVLNCHFFVAMATRVGLGKFQGQWVTLAFVNTKV